MATDLRILRTKSARRSDGIFADRHEVDRKRSHPEAIASLQQMVLDWDGLTSTHADLTLVAAMSADCARTAGDSLTEAASMRTPPGFLEEFAAPFVQAASSAP